MRVDGRSIAALAGGLAAGVTAGVAFGAGDERPNPGTTLVMAGMGTGFAVYGTSKAAQATDTFTRGFNQVGAFAGAALAGAAVTTLVRGGTDPAPDVPDLPQLQVTVPGTTTAPLGPIPTAPAPHLSIPSPAPGPSPVAPLDVDAILRGGTPAGGGSGASW